MKIGFPQGYSDTYPHIPKSKKKYKLPKLKLIHLDENGYKIIYGSDVQNYREEYESEFNKASKIKPIYDSFGLQHQRLQTYNTYIIERFLSLSSK